jgi:hypothetical protein
LIWVGVFSLVGASIFFYWALENYKKEVKER